MCADAEQQRYMIRYTAVSVVLLYISYDTYPTFYVRTFLALVIGVRIASTITTSSGLSREPARAPAEAERCEPIISIRRAASMALLSGASLFDGGEVDDRKCNGKCNDDVHVSLIIFRGRTRISRKKYEEALFRVETEPAFEA